MVMVLKPSVFVLLSNAPVCSTCVRFLRRHGPVNLSVQKRQYSNPSTNKDKPYYVTSPIFYVNAAPHVGHLYSMIIPDILKKWQILQGKQAIYCTGTDEHGMKIQRAAQKARQDPKTFCDMESDVFKALAVRAEIANDHFIRTTDLEHKEAVQYAWQMLEQSNHIYLSKHEGWYSVSDETYYPQSSVHLIIDPPTGRKIMASVETGKEVEWTSEINYKFRLSAFRERLLEHYEKNPSFIVPHSRMKEVIKDISEGLEDLSISRPSNRLSWGIPVPNDETQTIYVWLDALINYITKAGYPWVPGKEHAQGWPADCQVIGKEIVRFHCIYWPAFLMALEIPLPRQILTHGHWTLGNEKMSKSTGNVVNPFFAIDRFGAEVMRFYLAHDGPASYDADYDNEHIITRYKKSLQGGLGNLASRITRGKKWNVSEATRLGASGKLTCNNERCLIQEKMLKGISVVYAEEMENLRIGPALHKVMGAVYATNGFMQHAQPWKLANTQSETELMHVIYLCAEACRITGILLQPFMPKKMTELLDMFGVDASRRSFAYAHLGADDNYGISKIDLGRGIDGVLFPMLTNDA